MTKATFALQNRFRVAALLSLVSLVSGAALAQSQRTEQANLVFAGNYELVGGNTDSVCARNLTTRQIECKPVRPSTMITIGALQSVYHTNFATCGLDKAGRFNCWNFGSDFKPSVVSSLAGGQSSDYSASGGMVCKQSNPTTQVCFAPRFEGPQTDTNSLTTFRFSRPLVAFGTFEGRACGLEQVASTSSRLTCFYSKSVGTSEQFNLPQDPIPGAQRLWVGESSLCVDSETGLRCFDKTGEMQLKASVSDRTQVGLAAHGGGHFCWVNPQGTELRCEQLNAGSWSTAAYTVPNNLARGLPAKATGIAAGDDYTCLLLEDSSIRCFGASGSPVVVRPQQLPQGLVSLSASRNSACGLTADGTSRCWGSHDASRKVLEDDGSPVGIRLSVWGACAWNKSGVTCSASSLSKTPDLGEIIDVAISVESSSAACALHKTPMGAPEVRCWGNQPTIAAVPSSLTEPIAVSLNDSQACAASQSGIQCWGRNAWTETPPSVSNLRRLAVGPEFGCALDDFGLTCFGKVPEALSSFVEMERPGVIKDFALSSRGTFCAIREDHQVGCAVLASQSAGPNSPKGIQEISIVRGLQRPRNLQLLNSFGSSYGCASDVDGVRCWGVLPTGAR